MTVEHFVSFLLAGGLGGLIVAVAEALKKRADARREDRKQKVDETATLANSAKTIAESAGKVVELQDGQADDLLAQINALRADLQTQRTQAVQERAAFQERLTEAENRLARAERRAGESERQAHEFRQDVIRLGEQLDRERQERQAELKRERAEYQANINKLVVIIEAMFEKMRAAGLDPGVDLDALKRMVIVEAPK